MALNIYLSEELLLANEFQARGEYELKVDHGSSKVRKMMLERYKNPKK